MTSEWKFKQIIRELAILYPELIIKFTIGERRCYFSVPNKNHSYPQITLCKLKLLDYCKQFGDGAQIAILLHEIGHYLDYRDNYNKFRYEASLKRQMNCRIVIRTEKRANQYAFKLAAKFGVPLDSVFLKTTMNGLKSYGVSFDDCYEFIKTQKSIAKVA